MTTQIMLTRYYLHEQLKFRPDINFEENLQDS